MSRKSRTSRLGDETGTAMVELALVMPLLLLLLLGMTEFGKAYNYWNDTNQIAADGARFAAVNRDPSPVVGQTLQNYLKSQSDTPELNGIAQVCITYPNGTHAVGDPVKVTVTAPYAVRKLPFLGPALNVLDYKTINITGSATMRIEQDPTAAGATTNYTTGCST
jgi:Flp pilus assembly protein TadG